MTFPRAAAKGVQLPTTMQSNRDASVGLEAKGTSEGVTKGNLKRGKNKFGPEEQAKATAWEKRYNSLYRHLNKGYHILMDPNHKQDKKAVKAIIEKTRTMMYDMEKNKPIGVKYIRRKGPISEEGLKSVREKARWRKIGRILKKAEERGKS